MRVSTWLGVVPGVLLGLACSRSPSVRDPGGPVGPTPVTWDASFTVSAQDAGGWSILRPSADSRLIYVSAAGDDGTARAYLPSDPEIGADPYLPAGAVLPYATLGAALAQMRAGYPDYLLLRRGDAWEASAPLQLRAGRSAAERAVVGTYGTARGGGGFHDNYFSSSQVPSRWFAATGAPSVSLDGYRARSGDTTSIAGTRTYVDPGRTLETYLASLGLATNVDAFVAELVQQSSRRWRPELTARAINRYLREGFCISGHAGCR